MKKILIIEDDTAIHQAIVDILENADFKAFSAFNGKAGIQLAKEVIPDLIICDIMMPGVDGYNVLKELSEESSTATIPFIFLSAMAEKQNIRQGMELGADDYLTKPFKIDELLNAVEIRFKKQEMLNQKLKNNPEIKTEDEKVQEDGHLFLEVNGSPKLVKVNTIVSITAYIDYTNVFLSTGEKIMVRRLLKNWEDILPEKSFIRIHRSTIINLNYVEKVEKWFNRSFALYLKNIKEPFIVSRRYSSFIRSKLHYK